MLAEKREYLILLIHDAPNQKIFVAVEKSVPQDGWYRNRCEYASSSKKMVVL